MNARVIHDETGKPAYYEGSVSDITARKETARELETYRLHLEELVEARTAEMASTNAQLRKEIEERQKIELHLREATALATAASHAKSEFLANMSHELRTPLNAVIGFSELLQDGKIGPLNTIQEEFLSDILHSARHLLSLINDILDLTKVEAGKLELNVSEIYLESLLLSSLVMVKEKAMRHGIVLTTEIEDDIPETIFGDERKLKQILYNLLFNAAKFSSKGGFIRLCARPVGALEVETGWDGCFTDSPLMMHSENGFILVSVIDNGLGIAPKDIKRIFLPFEQADSTLARKFQGTGLGLALAKRMVELHHGEIWVESEGEGKGSAFHFLLPRKQPPPLFPDDENFFL